MTVFKYEYDLIDSIIQDVCELPGDNDPDADDTLILSVDDLRVILERNAAKPRKDAERPLLERIEALEAEMITALEPFVREFDRRRDSYIKRYPSNPGIGAHNFDAMPDDWIMEDMPLTMGDFRRAALALAKH